MTATARAAVMRREAAGSGSVDMAVADGLDYLLRLQRDDGHWVFELEADATIAAEYIMLEHYLDEIDAALQRRLAAYLRRIQGTHGGWPLFHDGDFNISASVKAYYALKLAGDDPNDLHMRRAREAILAHGGAFASNVFTRIALALFGQLAWRYVPAMPVEIVLLPESAPFHLSKVSYWSRTVIAPLLVLMALKPQARNPRRVGIAELFVRPPRKEPRPIPNATGSRTGEFFIQLDRFVRLFDTVSPSTLRRNAVTAAMAFVKERLNGEDGLGAIYPAMANAVMAMDALGYPKDEPDLVTAKEAIRRLIVHEADCSWVQPCVSPIWDTGLAAHAVLEAGLPGDSETVQRALDWLVGRQILDVKGDWSWRRPDLPPGGWAFQYRNDYYPDVDDTAVVVMALHRADPVRYRAAIERAEIWILGMQSANGGWGAFDVDNTCYYLNHIPFADHGALLDPPTSDVTARCLGMLAQLGYDRNHPAVDAAVRYLLDEQEPDGSWFGRWGTNYVYGTWSVLTALNAVGEDPDSPAIRKAVRWLEGFQQPDGGWGEDGATYWNSRRGEVKASTASQTAWAILGLMAAGEVNSEAVRRGVEYLCNEPREDGRWREKHYNAVGFPRVFYLIYHGYAAYFPTMALARYRNLKEGRLNRVPHGF